MTEVIASEEVELMDAYPPMEKARQRRRVAGANMEVSA